MFISFEQDNHVYNCNGINRFTKLHNFEKNLLNNKETHWQKILFTTYKHRKWIFIHSFKNSMSFLTKIYLNIQKSYKWNKNTVTSNTNFDKGTLVLAMSLEQVSALSNNRNFKPQKKWKQKAGENVRLPRSLYLHRFPQSARGSRIWYCMTTYCSNRVVVEHQRDHTWVPIPETRMTPTEPVFWNQKIILYKYHTYGERRYRNLWQKI